MMKDNLNMARLKLPVAIQNDELVWHEQSSHAKRLGIKECEEQYNNWATTHRRMQDKQIHEMGMFCPNGNWDILITLDEVEAIAKMWDDAATHHYSSGWRRRIAQDER